MNLYPIMLNLTGRRAVIIGGGPVAMRKVRPLKDAGAMLTVVAEEFTDKADLAGVDVIGGKYRPEHLAGAMVVVACTDDVDLNARIAADARRAGALVNCVDQPDNCDFFAPAVVSDGEVVVAIATGGAAPALAGRLKEQVARCLPERIGEFAETLGKMREIVKGRVDDVHRRGEILKTLAGRETYEAFLKDGADAVGKILDELTV